MKFSKKFGFALVVLSIFFSSAIFADTIGVLDTDKILLTYKDAKEYQTKLEEKQADIQEYVDKQQEKIDKAEAKGDQEKVEELQTALNEELKVRQEELFRMNNTMQQTLITEIVSTAKVIAREYSIDVVVDKRATFVGGFDLTDFVIDRLNSRK